MPNKSLDRLSNGIVPFPSAVMDEDRDRVRAIKYNKSQENWLLYKSKRFYDHIVVIGDYMRKYYIRKDVTVGVISNVIKEMSKSLIKSILRCRETS